MKAILLFAITLLLHFSSFSQDTIFLKKEGNKITYTDRPPQSIFVELGGSGLATFTANYDFRFNKRLDGLGMRFGLGYSFDNSFNVTSVPIGINYLMGNKTRGRYFEMGVGETVLFTGSFNNSLFDSHDIGNIAINPNTTYLATVLMLGYRSQPIRGGFNFRAGITPFFLNRNVAIGGYVSFGYNF